MKTKRNRWGSRFLLIILALIIVGTSLTGLVLAKGDSKADNPDLSENVIGTSDPIADDTVITEQFAPPAEEKIAESKGFINKEHEKIEQIKKKTSELRSNRLRKEDTFNYSKADIEKLVLNGSSIEDIYLSDQIANEWLVSPDQLVELKRKSSASWDEIATAIQTEKESRLKELLSLYPTVRLEFSKTKISLAEKVEVLEILHEKGNKEVKKENLDKAIQEVAKNQVSREHAYSIPKLDIQEDINS